MQFSKFIKTVSGNTITLKNSTPILNIKNIKYYSDNAFGTFSKKEFRWSFDKSYWSSWETLNQGNLSNTNINNNVYFYLEIVYTLKSINSGTVTTFIINYIEETAEAIAIASSCSNIIEITNADTLEGQPGLYYLLRSNHKGAQPITSITGLSTYLTNLSSAITNFDTTYIKDASLSTDFYWDVSSLLRVDVSTIEEYVDPDLDYGTYEPFVGDVSFLYTGDLVTNITVTNEIGIKTIDFTYDINDDVSVIDIDNYGEVTRQVTFEKDVEENIIAVHIT